MSDKGMITTTMGSLFELGYDVFSLTLDLLTKKQRPKDQLDIKEYFEKVKFEHKVDDGEIIKPKIVSAVKTDYGFKYSIITPPATNKETLNKLCESLEISKGCKITHRMNKEFWVVEFFTNELPEKIDFELTPRIENHIVFPVGITYKGIEFIDTMKNPNTYIVGTTNSGKSTCSKSILSYLISSYTPNELELYLGDLKRVEFSLFKNVKHCKRFEHTVDGVNDMIEQMLMICEDRYTLFDKAGVTNIFEYNHMKQNKLNYKILFLEEVVMLLQDKKSLGMKNLKLLLSICRAAGVYVIMTTQRPSMDVIDNVVKANINNRICFKVEDSKNSIIAIDDEGAEELRGAGHGIIKIGSVKTEFQGYYIDDKKCRELIKPYLEKKDIQENKTTIKHIGFVDGKSNIDDVIKNMSEQEIENIDLSFLDKL